MIVYESSFAQCACSSIQTAGGIGWSAGRLLFAHLVRSAGEFASGAFEIVGFPVLWILDFASLRLYRADN